MPQRFPSCSVAVALDPAPRAWLQSVRRRVIRLRAWSPAAVSGVLVCSGFGLAPANALTPAPDLRTNDTALIAHIKKTDYVFSLAFDRCTGEKLTRHHAGSGAQRFEYVAFCSARAAQESDCPGFDVKARGTVDSPTWATVRTQVLTLRCSN